jgi:hypothetical protein
MSSGAGVIVLAPLVPVAVGVAAAAVPVAAVYGLYKGGQAVYRAYQEDAERRRRIAEAAEVARLRTEYDAVTDRIAQQEPAAAEVEVAPAAVRHWSAGFDATTARAVVAEARAARHKLEADVEQARADLARDLAQLETERRRRQVLDEQAAMLRVTRPAPARTDRLTKPSAARAAAAEVTAENDQVAAALRSEQAQVQQVQARLAEALGYRDRLAHLAERSHVAHAAPASRHYPDLSVLEEARRHLADATQDQDAIRGALHDSYQEDGRRAAEQVFAAIRPYWEAEGPKTSPDRTRRAALRASVQRALERTGPLESLPASVAEALSAIEAGTEHEARDAVARANHDLEVLTRRRAMAARAHEAVVDLTERSAGVRSPDLARRCAAVQVDIQAHDGEWTDAKLSELLNVRVAGLRAELRAYAEAEALHEERTLAKYLTAKAKDAVAAMRGVLEDSASWQILELDESTHRSVLSEDRFVDGFIAREVGDLTTALLVRATHEGRIETFHQRLRGPAGMPDAETVRARCDQVATLIEETLGPTAQTAVGDEFTVKLTVDPGLQGTYRPTDAELDQMEHLDREIEIELRNHEQNAMET